MTAHEMDDSLPVNPVHFKKLNRAERAFVLDTFKRIIFAWPILKWRHHGIGALQAYLPGGEGGNPERRVHVWDPRLVREGIRDCGDAHDHRFDLISHVLLGELPEVLYMPPGPSDAGLAGFSWMDAWEVQNARAAGPEKHFDGTCRYAGQSSALKPVLRVHSAFSSYSIPRGVIHATRPTGLAMTLCEMHDKQGQARIWTPQGKEPVHAFGPPGNFPIQEVLQSALSMIDQLRRVIREFDAAPETK